MIKMEQVTNSEAIEAYEEMLQSLDRRKQVLRADFQTAKAVFDAMWNELSEQEQRVCRRIQSIKEGNPIK